MARKKTKASGWRNRIVGEGEESPDQLLANPRNWRIHPTRQQEAVTGILDQVGWVQRVVVNRRTGFLVDGHMRVSLALSREEPTIPVVYVDLTPEEEELILASLDPSGDMAVKDVDKLRELVDSIEIPVEGTLRDMLDESLLDAMKSIGADEKSEADEETDDDDSKERAATPDGWVVFQVSMPSEDRDIVLGALESLKTEFDTATLAETLVALCRSKVR